MKILMFGAVGPYSQAFSRALAPHADLVACIVRRPVDGLLQHWLRHRPVREEVLGFACPVFSIAAHDEDATYHALARLRADLVISAGFPRKLPTVPLGALARLGALNVHPALLPRDRGPCPPFWVFRRGEVETGVSVHLLTDALDAGDVLLQERMPVPFGCTGAELFEALGALGGKLVARHLPALLAGSWHLVPQTGDPGPWARKPLRGDLEVRPLEWRAKSLFAFVRGARTFGTPWANLADEVYHFTDALAFDPGQRLPGEFVVYGKELLLGVSDGTVTLRVY